ncbi:hypothetical protein GYMLUDRAFT_957610 [Collybiopsis luxurians FD-317 M1]|nr:hypothetical protein GYMLUDRAFT_957610 [Collybiopsis luxurians FD-317 M1]
MKGRRDTITFFALASQSGFWTVLVVTECYCSSKPENKKHARQSESSPFTSQDQNRNSEHNPNSSKRESSIHLALRSTTIALSPREGRY